MSSNRTSHVTESTTEKKLEIRDIIPNFHFTVENETPLEILLPTVKIFMSLLFSSTSNSISTILLPFPSSGPDTCNGGSYVDKSGAIGSKSRCRPVSEYCSYSLASAFKSLSMD
uniref:Serine/threonine-protein kinase ATM n=1 Tax=Rhizophora mucronata TaxID=61149 RepID=A0A2P2JCV7_RHIMU